LLGVPGIVLVELSPEILMASSFLPDSFLGDPVDCIIAATAREFDYTLVTRDRMLLDYAEAGHIRAVPC
jgi:PIN domain nuclease of toxin-antitoxin system